MRILKNAIFQLGDLKKCVDIETDFLIHVHNSVWVRRYRFIYKRYCNRKKLSSHIYDISIEFMIENIYI